MLDRRNYAKDPTKPVRRVGDMVDRPFTEQERWRIIIRDDSKLIGQILLLQKTLRLTKIIPTWETFIDTEYGFDVVKNLNDSRMLTKFRAWWDLLFKILDSGDSDEVREMNGKRIQLAVLWLTMEKARKDYARTDLKLPAFPELAKEYDTIIEAVSTGYGDLLIEFG